jgi:hypothetical protein
LKSKDFNGETGAATKTRELWMDVERNLLYLQYLIILEQRVFLPSAFPRLTLYSPQVEACTKEKIASIETLQEDLRNGIVL